jgi:hypothetical protein
MKSAQILRLCSDPRDQLRSRPAAPGCREFTRLQAAHAARAGYRGTIVTHVGDGRHVTLTP